MTPCTRIHRLAIGSAVAALLGLTLLTAAADPGTRTEPPGERLTSRPRPAAPMVKPAAVGEEVRTDATQRRRLLLADGSVVYLSSRAEIKVTGERRLRVSSGEVFVDVAPRAKGAAAFTVTTPDRELTCESGAFVAGIVSNRDKKSGTGVIVARGRVKVNGVDATLLAGQKLPFDGNTVLAAQRASSAVDWARDLMAAAESPLVPASRFGGGALVAVDPDGQEAKLSLRKYHIDVHIEDGFARTTIDQTYFNHTAARLEGTFYFPLPPDASLSRLAMYVDGKRMEGGMVERDFGRQVYEKIVTSQRDPALLEWVDGSTFKMRVFPLEARQEKRVVLSYTQKLPALDEQMEYRFPAGHSLEAVADWSFHARVRGGAEFACDSPSHSLEIRKDGTDLLLDAAEKNVKANRDVVLTLTDRGANAEEAARFSSFEQDGARYLMMRYRPALVSDNRPPEIGIRNWVFLFESSGDRDPLLARTQIEIIRGLLANAEADDTFTVLTAGTRVRAFADKPLPVTAENVRGALAFLEGSHLIGALDLGKALSEAEPFLKAGKNALLVHVGSGVAAMGERRDDVLAKRLPDETRYVGVGVGRRWNRNLMKIAAERSGGYFTQINPDEPVSWRAFDLAATLNTPRLLDVTVTDKAEKATFLTFTNMAAQGEELCAVARVGAGEALPEMVAVRGRLNGAAFARDIPVKGTTANIGHLPRTWAKLEIERLLASFSRETPASARAEIVALSKAMYVMTPFTSLLVLENEEMYQQFKVDRGRKDHWALYDCPEKIAVVYEPLEGMRGEHLNTGGGGGGGSFAGSPGGGGSFPGSGSFSGSSGSGSFRRIPEGFGPKHTVMDAIADPRRAENAIEQGQLFNQSEHLEQIDFKMKAIKHLEEARRKDLAPEERPLLRRMGVDPSTPEGARLAAVLLRPLSESGSGSGPHNDSLGGSATQDWMDSRPRGIKAIGASINADSSLMVRGNISDDSDSLLYERPRFSGDDRLFFDLVTYAPGMDTNRADILAIVEAEAAASPTSRPGTIDDGARRLFEKARPKGWQTLTFPAEGDRPGFGITFDGAGRYSYERILPPGIRERVVCDGTTLLHLYADLGIGARRTVSRFHRLEFARTVPWAVPAPDDVARGADLKVIAERTVAVVPHGAANRKDSNGKPIPYAVVHYVFAEDGRLTERRIVEIPANKVVYRQMFGADGTITAKDGDGKELALVKATLREGKQPDQKPDAKDLVILPLPYRDLDTTRKALGIQKKPLQELTFEEARAVLAEEIGAGSGSGALQVCQQSLFRRDQKQLGLYVLLAACGVNLDSGNVDVLEEHLHEPLAQYLALHSSPVLRKHASQWAVGSGQWGEGFLQHLAVTHALFQRWSNNKALGATEAKRREERDRALDYVRRNKGTAFGWGLLCLMKDRADEDEGNKKDVRDTHKALAEAWPLFREMPALAYAAEYEHARSLWKAGQHTEGRQRFVDLYEQTSKAGGLPRIEADFRLALVGDGSEADLWGDLMRKTAAALVEGKHRPAVLALAAQCRQIGDESMGTSLLGSALDGIKDDKERQRMTLAAIDFLQETGQYAEADRLLRTLLTDAELAKRPDLWRLAGGLAGQRDQSARQFECLERALDAEYHSLPEVINLRSVREEYGRLLGHYQDLANALERLQVRPPADFTAKVVRTADRWRALDPEADGACELAGRILRTLGERELVWDYLTTPVARRPNESGPWVALADSLSRTGELDLAERAYTAASESEPTNAQILWDRAQNLRQSGKLTEAQKLYRQLAEGDWQPRFNWLRTQAKWQLEKK
jgi:tetratricopeptide (TPR) repeat protein